MLFERIQELCKERNISVTKLETNIGVGKGTIIKWKNARASFELVSKVAKYFDVPMEFFMVKAKNETNDS